MTAVVLIIVPEGIGGNLIKAFHHAALVVKIREAQGTGYLGHAHFLSVGRYSIYEGFGNLHVIYEVNPAKANLLVLPVLVCNLIDDCCHAAH